MGTPQRGFECTLSVTPSGGAVSTVAKARDVELNAGSDDADITSRSSAGWEESLQGLKEWFIKADQLWITDDAGLQALRSAFLSGATLAVSLLTLAGNGFSGNAFISEMGNPQPLAGGVTLPVTLQGTGALTKI
jgi:predicted secreted protein